MQQYLPTGKFSAIVFSIFLAAGLIYGANAVTHPTHTLSQSTLNDAQLAAAQANWQATLAGIQAQAGVSIPTAPDPSVVNGLLEGAKSSNVTDTVARSLLVNLTNAKAQGLGDDIPTQDQLISDATSQIKQNEVAAYTQQDLVVVADSKESQKEYGNTLATILAANANANEYANTMIDIDNGTSLNDASQLKKLPAIAAQYKELTDQLLKVPVPETLVPFHLELVNNFKNITDSYDAMAQLLTDPLQGLAGLQTYQSLTTETSRVFINIAQAFNKDGILFTKDEPGASWAALLSEQ